MPYGYKNNPILGGGGVQGHMQRRLRAALLGEDLVVLHHWHCFGSAEARLRPGCRTQLPQPLPPAASACALPCLSGPSRGNQES